MKIVIETDNLYLREIETTDAPFLIELLNSPAYIRFIGDRGVRTIADAVAYIEERPRESYQENGFGLWVIILKATNIPAGMCGLINRPELDDIDIGFALLPGYEGKGIGYEAASASLRYGLKELNIPKIIGIVDPENAASIKLLKRIGLQQESTVRLPGETLDLLVFGSTEATLDFILMMNDK
jgi:RimJ/RimL family protein N-acetyltransferase